MQLGEYRRMAAAEAAHWWYAATRELLHEVLAPHLGPGARILDAGCGTGATGGWLSSRGWIAAVDAEPLALSLYRETRPAAALVAAEIGRLPFAAGSFET